MKLRKDERIKLVKSLINYLDESKEKFNTIEVLYQCNATQAENYRNFLELLNSLEFNLDDNDLVKLSYKDTFTGKISIPCESISSMAFCYGIMLFYADISSAIMAILASCPRDKWSVNPLYMLRVELSVRLHTLFS